MSKTVNQGQEKGRAEARKRGRAEKTICENPCNRYSVDKKLFVLIREIRGQFLF